MNFLLGGVLRIRPLPRRGLPSSSYADLNVLLASSKPSIAPQTSKRERFGEQRASMTLLFVGVGQYPRIVHLVKPASNLREGRGPVWLLSAVFLQIASRCLFSVSAWRFRMTNFASRGRGQRPPADSEYTKRHRTSTLRSNSSVVLLRAAAARLPVQHDQVRLRGLIEEVSPFSRAVLFECT